MTDFSNISSAMNSNDIKVTVVGIGEVKDYTVNEGTTLSSLKERYGLSEAKFITEDGRLVATSEQLTDGLTLFVSVPKKNG